MGLIERQQKTTDATSWPGRIPMNYLYTAGRGAEEFFTTLKEKGQFVGSRCGVCNKVYVPVSIFCEACFERIEGNRVDLANRGTVHTFTVCHETYNERHKPEPSVVAAIQIDGTDSVLFHRLGELDPGQCRIGMPVEAVFKPESERKGSILDITYFRPLKG